MPADPDLRLWADAIERAIGPLEGGLFCRAMVVAQTDSTMDLARADGTPGLIVIADRQTAGRGRLGRAWSDTAHLGLAVTFTLEAERFDAAALSIAAGVASLETCLNAFERRRDWSESRPGPLGLRWPNDVVERRETGRKLCGVLIERAGGIAMIGVGINVLQGTEDFPVELQSKAASLAMHGSERGRLDVLLLLIDALAAALLRPTDQNAEIWQRHDVLVGTRRTFEHAGHRYTGVVEAIRPTSHVLLRTEAGATVSLPALTTSMVHES